MVGIDRSKNMIELAKKPFSLLQLSFQLMDATNISVKEKFDVAFSTAALHWINNHSTFLAGLKKHLNENAKILFQMGGYGNAQDVVKILEEITASEKWRTYFEHFSFPYRFCRIEDYQKWLPEAGYQVKRLDILPKDMVHKNEERFKGWLRTTWFPYTDQLPENMKEDFLSQIVGEYTKKHPVDSEGKSHVKMIRLEVEAMPL